MFFWGFLSINRYQRGFKLLYGDRGPSRCCMNHLVATAQLEMSRLISVPRASLLVRRLHLYLWHWKELIKERSLDLFFGANRPLLHWEAVVYNMLQYWSRLYAGAQVSCCSESGLLSPLKHSILFVLQSGVEIICLSWVSVCFHIWFSGMGSCSHWKMLTWPSCAGRHFNNWVKLYKEHIQKSPRWFASNLIQNYISFFCNNFWD